MNCPSVQNAAGCVTIDTDTIPDTRVPNSKTQWAKYGDVTLTSHHKRILQSNSEWLDDALVTATQNLLKQQYPLIGGFQATVLGESLAMEPQPGEFVQILCVRGNHWICASTVGCGPSSINIYDSLHGHLDDHTRKLVADLMQSKQKHIEVCYTDVQRQSGVNDCGLFSIAFATSICCGEDPTTLNYRQRDMRTHLFHCIDSGEMTAFPTRSIIRRPKPAKKERLNIFCVCRQLDDGTEMVECSTCKEWFHTSCVRVPQRVLKDEELSWTCSSCVEQAH